MLYILAKGRKKKGNRKAHKEYFFLDGSVIKMPMMGTWL